MFVWYIWTVTFYSSIGSGILTFFRSNLVIISFVGVFNQRNKEVNIFKDLIDTTAKFIKLFSLSWIRTMQLCLGLLHGLLLLFIFRFFTCLFTCLFVYLFICVAYLFILFILFLLLLHEIVSLYLLLFMSLLVDILYYNLLKFSTL